MQSLKRLYIFTIVTSILVFTPLSEAQAKLCKSLFQNETPASAAKKPINVTFKQVIQILNSAPETIARSLDADGITLEKLKQHGIPMTNGLTRPLKYTTAHGESFLLKSEKDAQHEVAAYMIANQIIPGRVPPSLVYVIEGKPFTVQKWIPWSEISITKNSQTMKYENIAKLIDWNLPSDVVLFDLLIGNLDRARAKGHNYSIYTESNTTKPDTSALTVIFDHKEGFASWKLERVWEYNGLPVELRDENYIRHLVQNNPLFMQRMEALSEASLRSALTDYLSPMALNALIARRAELIQLKK